MADLKEEIDQLVSRRSRLYDVLNDSQEHAQIVRLEKIIERIDDEIKKLQEKSNG
jgi:hypothetical protein